MITESILSELKNKTSSEQQHNISAYIDANPNLFLECVEFAIKDKNKETLSFLLSLPYSLKNDKSNIFHTLLNSNYFSTDIANIVIESIKNNPANSPDTVSELLNQASVPQNNTALLLAFYNENIEMVKFVSENTPVIKINNQKVLDSLFEYFKKYCHEHNNSKDRTDFLELFDCLNISFDKVSFKQDLTKEIKIAPSFSSIQDILHYLHNQKGLGLNFVGNLLTTSNKVHLSQSISQICNSVFNYQNINTNKVQDNDDTFKNFINKFLYTPNFPIKHFLHSILFQPYFDEYLTKPGILGSVKKDENICLDVFNNAIISYIGSYSIKEREINNIIKNINTLIDIYPESFKEKYSQKLTSNLAEFDRLDRSGVSVAPLVSVLVAKGFQCPPEFVSQLIFNNDSAVKNLPEQVKEKFDDIEGGFYRIKPEVLINKLSIDRESTIVQLITDYDHRESLHLKEQLSVYRDIFIREDEDKTAFAENVINAFDDIKVEMLLNKNTMHNTDLLNKLFTKTASQIFNFYVFFKDNYPETNEDSLFKMTQKAYEKISKSPFFIASDYTSQIEKLLITKTLERNEIPTEPSIKRRRM